MAPIASCQCPNENWKLELDLGNIGNLSPACSVLGGGTQPCPKQLRVVSPSRRARRGRHARRRDRARRRLRRHAVRGGDRGRPRRGRLRTAARVAGREGPALLHRLLRRPRLSRRHPSARDLRPDQRHRARFAAPRPPRHSRRPRLAPPRSGRLHRPRRVRSRLVENRHGRCWHSTRERGRDRAQLGRGLTAAKRRLTGAKRRFSARRAPSCRAAAPAAARLHAAAARHHRGRHRDAAPVGRDARALPDHP